MGLADIIRSGIQIAQNVTAGAQVNVTHEAWTGQDEYGAPTFAAAQTLTAILDLNRKEKATLSGQLVTVVATLTILTPITDNGAAGRKEPIDPRDVIRLPDGTTGPILETPNAVVDPATNRPFFHTVLLGETNQR